MPWCDWAWVSPSKLEVPRLSEDRWLIHQTIFPGKGPQVALVAEMNRTMAAVAHHIQDDHTPGELWCELMRSKDLVEEALEHISHGLHREAKVALSDVLLPPGTIPGGPLDAHAYHRGSHGTPEPEDEQPDEPPF